MEKSSSIRELLYDALPDVLKLPLDLYAMSQTLASLIDGKDLRISSIGPTSNIIQSIQKVLKPNSVQVNNSEPPHVIYSDWQRQGSESIAIIGMSGRFPGGGSLEQFWSVLENGLDLHQTVNIPLF